MKQFSCEVIPNPVNTELFQPGNLETVRRKWGVQEHTFVVGLGAALIRDERKQIQASIDALVEWAETQGVTENLLVWVFGKGRPFRKVPNWVRFVGRSPSAEVLSEWYTLMDVYISMSRFETFGNTLAEAAACGTPSICRAGSGMSDVITHGATGLEVHTMKDCTEAVDVLFRQPERAREMGAAAMTRSRSCFQDRVVAQKFLELYGRTSTQD
jgi:glycosyltransferase involved in cell wall biosynthesis